MVAVRNALVPLRLMITGALGSRALRRVCGIHRKHVLVDMIPVLRVHVAVVQIVRMSLVLNLSMPAVLPMDVRMIIMWLATHYRPLPSLKCPNPKFRYPGLQ